MALVAFSVILIFLGIVCGAALVAAALGWAAVTGAALWVLFPLLVIGGFTLLAMGASHAAVRQVSRPAALALLALATQTRTRTNALQMKARRQIVRRQRSVLLWIQAQLEMCSRARNRRKRTSEQE